MIARRASKKARRKRKRIRDAIARDRHITYSPPFKQEPASRSFLYKSILSSSSSEVFFIGPSDTASVSSQVQKNLVKNCVHGGIVKESSVGCESTCCESFQAGLAQRDVDLAQDDCDRLVSSFILISYHSIVICNMFNICFLVLCKAK